METHFPILLADGDEKDISFAKRAFRQAALQNPLRVVRDGEQVMAYLRGDGRYSDRERFPIPKLVIMGFNIARRTGLEVLEWIRTHSEFKELPIVMLSPSSLCPEMDLRKARRLGITAHLTRLPDSKELQHVYKIAVDQWNLLDTCPNRGAGKLVMRTWPRSQKYCARPKPLRSVASMMHGTV
jgi:CheY-like chemotaxis protein